LKVFYQIWSPKAERGPGKKLIVDYGYGRPGIRGDAKTIQDEVIAEQFDSSGSLLNGKKIPVSDLSPGNYRLSVSITDPATQEKTFASLGFRIVPGEGSLPAWDLYDDQLDQAIKNGTTDYQRALCYLATGDKGNAIGWLQRSMEKNPTELARAKLVDIYFGRQEFVQVAALYQRVPITNHTDEQTVLRIASSLDRMGKTQTAIEVLESSLRLRTPTAPLYLTLAGYYQQVGNPAKASEMESKAKSLLPVSTAPTT
jgi:tetratricopeptide (TPR) repeat protein